jgi:hypothetical protein
MVESRIGPCGGQGGFITLLRPNEQGVLNRMAYLQIIEHDTPRPFDEPPMDKHRLVLKFYELWSRTFWDDIVASDDQWSALCDRMKSGEIVMQQIIRSPVNRMRRRQFDLDRATFHPDLKNVILTRKDDSPMFTQAGIILPWQFIINGAGPARMVPEPEDEKEKPV